MPIGVLNGSVRRSHFANTTHTTNDAGSDVLAAHPQRRATNTGTDRRIAQRDEYTRRDERREAVQGEPTARIEPQRVDEQFANARHVVTDRVTRDAVAARGESPEFVTPGPRLTREHVSEHARCVIAHVWCRRPEAEINRVEHADQTTQQCLVQFNGAQFAHEPRYPFVIGMRRSLPKALRVMRTPGGI